MRYIPTTSLLSGLFHDRRGSVLPFMALLLTVGVGVAALTIDLANMQGEHQKLQIAADAAALAALVDLPDEAVARQAALNQAKLNLPLKDATLVDNAEVAFGVWDEQLKTMVAGSPSNTVEVTLSRRHTDGTALPAAFAGIFGNGRVEMASQSMAVLVNQFPCLLALADDQGIDLGNMEMNASNCAIHVNATMRPIEGKPNAALSARRICTVGGDNDTKPTYSPAPTTGCSALKDPYASMTPALPTSCNHTNAIINSGIMTPGVYCGTTMVIADTTMQSGVYYFKGNGSGSFKVNGSFGLTGQNVTLVGYDGLTFDFGGASRIHLEGSQGGKFEGFAMFIPSSQTYSATHSFRGGNEGHYEGSFYLPNHTLRMTGIAKGGISSPYAIFVVNRLAGDGQPTFALDSRFEDSVVPIPKGFRQAGLWLVK